MAKNLRWKIIVIAAVLFASTAVGVYPSIAAYKGWWMPDWFRAHQLRLGLALKDANVPIGTIRVIDAQSFAADGIPQANDQQFRQIADTQVGLVYDRNQS